MPQQKMNVKLIKSEGSNSKLHDHIMKSDTSLDAQDTKESQLSGQHGILKPPYPINELQQLVEHSTILQQCVEAYRRNITGFGALPSYLDDDTVKEETPEMIAEWNTIKSFIKYFHFDKSFEDLIGDIIEDREITGNGFLEIIRDGQGLPSEGSRLDPAYMYVTKLTDYVQVEQIIDGKKTTRRRRFRKYIQDVGTEKVFYKEFGDPRKMDHRTGEFVESIDEKYEANEVLHLKIGTRAYGVPRWIGQLIHMFGARKAEELNYRYFLQGRHTPMAILLHNAELSPESEQQLAEYAKAVEGSDNSHKFLIIEAEGMAEGLLEEEKKNAKVELKSLAEILQKDALFLDYDKGSREKVQSAFRLPDIYVGRSKDFNRATADTARYITEEQVFEPERNSLEWVFNQKFLPLFGITKSKLIFNKPEISNPEELARVLDVATKAQAVAPNDIRDIIGKLIGKDLEPFSDEKYDLPLGGSSVTTGIEPPTQIEKAYEGDDLTNLLKDLRDVIEGVSFRE